MKANVPLKSKIAKICAQIEKDENVDILFAVENGSRAWRMDSKDSDYDVRFVFKRTPEDYLALYNTKDNLEKYYDANCKPTPKTGCYVDAVGWDIYKYLTHLMDSNPTAIEWIISDIVYYGEQNKVFKDFALTKFNQTHLYNAYRGMSKNNYKKYIASDNQVTHKKYLYALRGLINAKYTAQFNKIPPIAFESAVNAVDIPEKIKSKINDIILIKKSGAEKDTVGRIKMLDQLIEPFLEKAEVFKPNEKQDRSLLNTELLRLILSRN